MSFAKAASFSMTVDPLLAVNSDGGNFTPFTNTSRYPTVYVKLKDVWPAVAICVSVDLVLGNVAQVTPTPVDLKYCPLSPVDEPA